MLITLNKEGWRWLNTLTLTLHLQYLQFGADFSFHWKTFFPAYFMQIHGIRNTQVHFHDQVTGLVLNCWGIILKKLPTRSFNHYK